jgi:DNA-binding transcriptional ArsR family regulator
VDRDELARAIEDLADRVARLEGSVSAAPPRDGQIVRALLDAIEGDSERSTGSAAVVYAGAGPWQDEVVAWQMGRTWDEARAVPLEPVARALSALASATRLRIVGELLAGPVSTGELAERLDLPSSGQLFHHLKELLAAGVIHQPIRGRYAIRRQHVVPVLAVLSATTDLSGPDAGDEPA